MKKRESIFFADFPMVERKRGCIPGLVHSLKRLRGQTVTITSIDMSSEGDYGCECQIEYDGNTGKYTVLSSRIIEPYAKNL